MMHTNIDMFAEFSKPEQALLKAIRCPQKGQGVIRALETICEGLEAFCTVSDLPRVHAWREVAKSLLERLDAMQEEFPSLGNPNPNVVLPVFSLLANPPKSKQGTTGEHRGLENLGRLVVSAVSRDEALRVNAIEGWATLRRARTSATAGSDWAKFSNAGPRTEKELQECSTWVKAQNLRELLDDLLLAVRTPVIAVLTSQKTDQTEDASVHEGAPVTDSIESNHYTKSKEFDPDDLEDPLNSDEIDDPRQASTDTKSQKIDKNSLIGWKIVNAKYCRYTQKFGLIGDRDRLHPDSFKRVCASLRKDFINGATHIKNRVVLAYLSAKTGLPAAKALQLPLSNSSYPYLDLPGKDLIWNYRYCVQSANSVEILHPRSPVELIRLALDDLIGDYLIELQKENSDANRLSDLLGVSDDTVARKTWLKGYRKYLRLHGDDVHPAYDARFAYSGADAYRQIFNGELEAVFLAQEFNSCAAGILHYITLPTHKVISANEKWEEFISFKPRKAEADTAMKGAIINIAREDVKKLWDLDQRRIDVDLRKIQDSSSISEIIDSFNKVATARAFAFLFLTGHRGTRLARLTNRALFSHPDLLFVFDKDVGSYQSDRVIPCHKLVDSLLSAWQKDISLVEKRAVQLGMSIQTIGRRALKNSHPDRTAFFQVRQGYFNGKPILERKSLGTGTIKKYALAQYEKPINIGRHFLVSELLAMGTSLWVVCALTGHARAGIEPFADPMSMSPQRCLKTLRIAMDSLFNSLELCAIAGSPSKVRLLHPLSGSLPRHLRDKYVDHHLDKAWRVLPSPFDKYSVTAVQMIEEVRHRLMSSIAAGDFHADLLLSMAVFDGLTLADQKIILADSATHLAQMNETKCWVWNRKDCSNEIILPINPRTQLSVHAISNDLQFAMDTVVSKVSSWLQEMFPALLWNGGDWDIYRTFMCMAARWQRYQISPKSLTAFSDAVPAVTPSRRSLLRIADASHTYKKTSDLPRAVRLGSRKSHIQHYEEIKALRTALREAADTEIRSGEELRRAKELGEKIDKIDGSQDKRVECLQQVIRAEIALRESGSKLADEFSSLSGYFSEVEMAITMLGANEHPRDFNGEDIHHWISDAKRAIDAVNPDKKAVKNNLPRFHGLKRFLVIGRTLNWEVPSGLFSDEKQVEVFSRSRKSAASTLFLEKDNSEIEVQLKSHFIDSSVLQNKALLANAFDQAAPLRHMERNVSRSRCIVKASNQMSIHTDGFSHLKSRHAARLISVSEKLTQKLDANLTKTTDRPSRFALLPDDASDWTQLLAIDAQIVNAMVLVTGEASVRHHSRRGTAICNRINPKWEDIARALFTSKWTIAEHIEARNQIEQMGNAYFIHATREAGHGHSLTTNVYYFSTWTFHFANEMLASLLDLTPAPALCDQAFGDGNNRRKIGQINRKRNQSNDIWKEIAIYCGRRSPLPALKPLESDPTLVLQKKEDEDHPNQKMNGITLMALILLGGIPEDYSTLFGYTDSQARAMNTALPDSSQRKRLMLRLRGEPTAEALRLDREFIFTDTATKIAQAVSSASISSLCQLRDDLIPDRSAVKNLHLNAKEMITRLKSHLDILPANLNLMIRSNSERSASLSQGDFQKLNNRVVVGKNSSHLGGHPKFQVIPADKTAGSEEKGRTSICCRAFVLAAIYFDTFMQGGKA